MILTRAFRKADLTAFVPIESLTIDGERANEFAQTVEEIGLAVTGIRNGQIIGCGGVYPLDGSSGEIWLKLSEECLGHKIETLRWIKCGMDIIEESYSFKQLNATIQCCFGESIKMVEWLGFIFKEERTKNGRKWRIYNKRV